MRARTESEDIVANANDLLRLDGRVALVTGGSRGIGRAACIGLADQGAAVVVHYLEQRSAAEDVAHEIEKTGGTALVAQADVTDPTDVRNLMASVERFADGRGLGILFNNAGIYPSASVDDLSVADWDRVVNINLRGPFLCIQSALSLLRHAGSASVVNIGTIGSYLGMFAVNYVAAKAGVVGLTRALARELGPDGIRVNCIVPSTVLTETTATMYPGSELEAAAAQIVSEVQHPRDLIGVLLFLASDLSHFVTGQTIATDGGRIFL
jgi:3-oxoacyl-[acyl-carrier protein] reductase